MVEVKATNREEYALITGASSGMGEAYAKKFATFGYNLIIVARNKDKLEELANSLVKKYGIKVEVIIADLNNNSDIDLIEINIKAKEHLTVLVNCAGFAVRKRFHEQDPIKQLNLIQVHVVASTRLIQSVLPNMIKKNRGIIINVSSLLALMTLNNNVIYSATKQYLNRLSENLQMELEGTNIKVQALNPGFTISNFHSTEEFKGVKKNYPKFFTMTADEVVAKSIIALKRREVIYIPGVANKLLVYFKFIFARLIMKSMKS